MGVADLGGGSEQAGFGLFALLLQGDNRLENAGGRGLAGLRGLGGCVAEFG